MPDRWQTYPFEFKGGLITNLSPLQHGTQAPGSARILKNFEPSVEGGYQRILGFQKYSSSIVPEFGDVKVHGSSQTGTTLVVGNLFYAPSAGDTLTIAGVTGTYTIASAGVSYNTSTKRATLTLTTSLNSSPADKAAVTFTSGAGLIDGVAAWNNSVVVCRNNNIYSGVGLTWTKINVPSYGTVLVNGGSQTGGTLAVDGLTEIPQIGDTFTVAGINLIYTVTATPTVTSGAATISISPNLDSSPADNAAVTWLTANRTSSNRQRFSKYRISTSEKIAGVDGTNYPWIWDGSTFKVLTEGPTDIQGAKHICFFKNQLFFAKDDLLTFTSPYTDDDFNPALGSGNINVGGDITGLVVFRDQLIIFSENKISRLTGNTIADFNLQPITRNIGCVQSDTIQEIGSDIMFLGPDGLRLLSGTDTFGDFSLATVSKAIQSEVTTITTNNTSFCSLVVKKKSQYRLFGYNSATAKSSASGILGTQLVGDSGVYFGWAELQGIKAYVADGDYYQTTETVVFCNEDGYVYQQESGNSFDGANISASFATPFVVINDPRLRKTFYKLFLYLDPKGSVSFETNLKLDFDDSGIVQPETISISNTSGTVAFYGDSTAKYGTALYGGKLKNVYETQVIGSGFAVSLQFTSNNTTPAFSLDAATLEFATFDRR